MRGKTQAEYSPIFCQLKIEIIGGMTSLYGVVIWGGTPMALNPSISGFAGG
jgi:hypothetical protein